MRRPPSILRRPRSAFSLRWSRPPPGWWTRRVHRQRRWHGRLRALRERADAILKAGRGTLFTYADAKSTPVKELKPEDFWKA